MAAPGAALPPCLLMQSDTLVATMYPLNQYYLRFSIGLNYEMFTFKRVHGRIVYWSDYRAVIHIELSHTCSLAQNIGDEPNTLRYALLSR